jgi:DNA mismatch repair protein MSH4
VWKIKKKNIIDQRVNQLLILKEAIDNSLELYHLLAPLKSALLVELRSVFGSDIVKSVKDLLTTVLEEDCRWAQSALELRKQKCYAVLSGANGFLDVTRQIYEEYNMDIGEMVKAYSSQYHVNFETRYDVKRGYILRIRNPDEDEGVRQLPDDVFINKHKANRFLECTTLEMIKCNMRINNVLSEIIVVSDQIVEELFEDKLTQPHVSLELFKVSEAVAVLDLICAFTELVASSFGGYVRPEFSTSEHHANKMAVKLGRHPILERTMRYRPYVPNDYYGSLDTARMNIVQGVNMSGKSIYLRTIALIAVMAQTGSFVPAEYAVLPVYRALYTRITPDASDLLSSTFSAEMTEMAYILRNLSVSGSKSSSTTATTNGGGVAATADGLSLVIIDELGRGSSVVDGLAITLAITEKLAQMPGVMTFMCTHFQDLVHLMAQRPGVATLQMQVNLLDADPNLGRDSSQTGSKVLNGSTIVMHYKAQRTNHSSSNAGGSEGSLETTTSTHMPGYGLKIANAMLFPARFLAEAEEVKQRLTAAQARRERDAAAQSQGNTAMARKKLVLELYETLVHISKLDTTQLDPTSLRRWLVVLQNKFIESCTE